jgi:ABC-type hemin transport system ATPase subunit
MVGFLGANGAGKTTTLKMLCGLIHPSSGSVQVAGHRPQRRQAEFLRRITLVMGPEAAAALGSSADGFAEGECGGVWHQRSARPASDQCFG